MNWEEFKKEILQNNPGIDKDLVDNCEQLEEQLKKIGVVIKPRYSLDHPLTGSKMLPSNNNRK